MAIILDHAVKADTGATVTPLVVPAANTSAPQRPDFHVHLGSLGVYVIGALLMLAVVALYLYGQTAPGV